MKRIHFDRDPVDLCVRGVSLIYFPDRFKLLTQLIWFKDDGRDIEVSIVTAAPIIPIVTRRIRLFSSSPNQTSNLISGMTN